MKTLTLLALCLSLMVASPAKADCTKNYDDVIDVVEKNGNQQEIGQELLLPFLGTTVVNGAAAPALIGTGAVIAWGISSSVAAHEILYSDLQGINRILGQAELGDGPDLRKAARDMSNYYEIPEMTIAEFSEKIIALNAQEGLLCKDNCVVSKYGSFLGLIAGESKSAELKCIELDPGAR